MSFLEGVGTMSSLEMLKEFMTTPVKTLLNINATRFHVMKKRIMGLPRYNTVSALQKQCEARKAGYRTNNMARVIYIHQQMLEKMWCTHLYMVVLQSGPINSCQSVIWLSIKELKLMWGAK